MAEFDCPTDQALRNYILGDCSDAISEEIEGHLAQCPTCEATISEFDAADDTLLRHLPLAGATATGAAATPPGWVDVLRRQPPPGDRGDVPNGSIDKDFQQAESDAAPRLPDACGNYELLGVLGRGGMGVVFLARHRQLDRRVALKVVRPDALSNGEARRRFQREIRILGGLNHPGIVMATDAGTVGAGAYLVMELIEGADLGRVVRDGGPLAIEAACEAGRQIAEALAAAHGSGAVHRDVKPSNIMVDLGGRVRLLDFGLAHMTLSTHHSGETSVGRLLGTLDYMAPEQADGRRQVDARADLYGLGATLFFLLCGRTPHGSRDGRSLLEHLRAVSHDDAPRVSVMRVDVPAELDALVARLLCRDPDGRPQSAAEVAAELSRWAGGSLAARVADFRMRLPTPEPESADGAAARQSLAELLGTSVTAAFGTAAARATPPSRRRRLWWWAALAPLVGIIMVGITIWLKTSRGTLKIESEVDDVTVEARNERDQVHELKIKKGKNEIVLDAGEYRVRLAGTHDGVNLDRDVMTLRRGDETIARITRVADFATTNRTASDREATRDDGPAPAERLYEGKSESTWKRLFEAETAPVPKLEAANALLALSWNLSAEAQLERILDVGEEVVRASFSQKALEFVFEDRNKAPVRVGGWRKYESDSPLQDAYRGFQGQLNNFTWKLSAEDLARGLCRAELEGNDPRAAFAASLLREPAEEYIKSVPGAVRIVVTTLDLPLRGLDRSAVCMLVGAHYADKAAGDQRTRILDALQTLAAQLLHAPEGELRSQMRRELLDVAASLDARDCPPDLRATIARIVLNEIETSSDAGRRLTIVYWLNQSRGQTAMWIRDRVKLVLDAWLPVVNAFLEEHRQAPADVRVFRVLETLDTVLPLYSDGDDWPVEKTQGLLTDILHASYADVPNLAADKAADEWDRARLFALQARLLAQIIRISGQIPDFVRTGLPRAPSIAKKLKKFEICLNNETSSPQFDHYFDFASGLLDEAPYEVIAMCTGESKLRTGSSQSNNDFVAHGAWHAATPTELLYAASSLKEDSHRVRSDLPADPLLVLAVLADLTGQSEAQDDRIATLFTGAAAAKMFREHLENLLSGSQKARTFAVQFLKKMADDAKSEKLRGAAGELLAPVAPRTGTPQSPVAEIATTSRPAADREATRRDAPVPVERMYQGKTESDWKRHFTAETEPVAKLKAASALLALSGELPPQSQVERALDVGEAIVRAAFGDDNFEFAFGIGGHPPAKSPAASRAERWRFNLDMPLNQEFNHFVNQSSEMLSKIPAGNLTRGLSQAVLKGNPARAAFAAAFLQDSLTLQIKSDPQAVQVIAGTLDVPLTGLDRSAVCLLVQSRYANEMSAEQRGKIVSQLRALAAFLLPAPQGRLRYQMRNALLLVSASLYGKEWPSDLGELIAQVVLNEIIEEPYAVSRRFGADIEFTKDRVSPYRSEQFAVNRAHMQPFLGAWVKTANAYLEAHPDRPADQGTRSVVKSLELVLPFYSQGDDWPVEKTDVLFSEFLRGYYTDTPDNLTDKPVKELLPSTPAALLTQIVRVTGQIPDFVRKGHPRSTAVVKKWKELVRGLNNEGELPQFAGHRFAPQFLDEAPYEAVRLCVGENQLPPGKRQIIVHGLPCAPTPTELLYAVSGVRDDRNNRRELPTDPLLVLAILADLTGESQAQDDRIATLFTDGLAARMFKEHLECLLTSPLKARTFAVEFLQKMSAGSKSEKLTGAVGDLLAPVAAGTEKPRPRDGE